MRAFIQGLVKVIKKLLGQGDEVVAPGAFNKADGLGDAKVSPEIDSELNGLDRVSWFKDSFGFIEFMSWWELLLSVVLVILLLWFLKRWLRECSMYLMRGERTRRKLKLIKKKRKFEHLIKEQGEDWIGGALASMTPDGLLWLCNIVEGRQNSHDNAFKDIPKEANPGFSINDFLEVVQNTTSKVGESDLPMNPDALVAIIEYYRDTYGPYEGWSKFCSTVRSSHTAMKMLGQIPASARTPSVGKSGCAGMITVAISASILAIYFGLHLVRNLAA